MTNLPRNLILAKLISQAMIGIAGAILAIATGSSVADQITVIFNEVTHAISTIH